VKPKQERRELQKLYAEIPHFKCRQGCTDCCGPVPATREEKRIAPQLAQTADTITNLVDENIISWCAMCPYARPGHGCAIYEDRPFICRLFGTSEHPMLKCHHGYHSEKQFTLEQTEHLVARYMKLYTHEEHLEHQQMVKAWKKKYTKEPDYRNGSDYDCFASLYDR
jgi:uncharacterized protein